MNIVLSEDARKQYKRLPKIAQTKILRKLEVLCKNPHAGKKLGGELGEFWSLRAWPYRIIYEINEKEKRVDVHKIKHRQGAYN